MMKRTALFCFMAITAQALFAQIVSLANTKEEKIVASYMMTFARLPRTDEINYWKGQPDYSLKEHIEFRRKWMVNNDRKELEGAIKSSYATIFGRAPLKPELDYWMGQQLVYCEMIGHHTEFLKTHKAEWDSVIIQSYKYSFGRLPRTDEANYWKSQTPIPYSELIRKHDDWKSKNGYSVKSAPNFATKISLNVNDLPFAMVPFSATLRSEIPKYLPQSYVQAVISTGGGNFVSTNSGTVISTGGGNCISTGGANVISTGGGNIITFGNGNVISTGGGNLIKK
jgi:hypothetical protein